MKEKGTTEKPRNKTGSIVSGEFLLDPKIQRYWPTVLYLAVLAGISIYSGHLIEVKVHELQRLRSEMKEYNSRYIDTRSRLMKESSRSKVVFRASAIDLIESPTPPNIIYVEK
ncbi:MAG: S-adenosyl-methyltransferase [Flavobacteriales bacterium]|nr:MAG: S-adenosyl-methyltransferase [Flavobacteriales bacterium]